MPDKIQTFSIILPFLRILGRFDSTEGLNWEVEGQLCWGNSFFCCCVCSLLLSLLSPICCSSLAWKQDRQRFHTYTHWPLINKSDHGPFPHTPHTPKQRQHTHTPGVWSQQVYALLDLHHTWRLSGSDLATQVFVCLSKLATQWCLSWLIPRDLFPSAVHLFFVCMLLCEFAV